MSFYLKSLVLYLLFFISILFPLNEKCWSAVAIDNLNGQFIKKLIIMMLIYIPFQLPQQENSFDCGLFLLHYLELFLAEAPAHFSPFKITKPSSFVSSVWFSFSHILLTICLFDLFFHH